MDELMIKTMEGRRTADGKLVLSNKCRSMLHLPPKRNTKLEDSLFPFLFNILSTHLAFVKGGTSSGKSWRENSCRIYLTNHRVSHSDGDH